MTAVWDIMKLPGGINWLEVAQIEVTSLSVRSRVSVTRTKSVIAGKTESPLVNTRILPPAELKLTCDTSKKLI